MSAQRCAFARFLIVLATVGVPQYARAQDADADGVPDAQDVCDNTPPGIAVAGVGRPRD
jgi:hypothetical protein